MKLSDGRTLLKTYLSETQGNVVFKFGKIGKKGAENWPLLVDLFVGKVHGAAAFLEEPVENLTPNKSAGRCSPIKVPGSVATFALAAWCQEPVVAKAITDGVLELHVMNGFAIADDGEFIDKPKLLRE